MKLGVAPAREVDRARGRERERELYCDALDVGRDRLGERDRLAGRPRRPAGLAPSMPSPSARGASGLAREREREREAAVPSMYRGWRPRGVDGASVASAASGAEGRRARPSGVLDRVASESRPARRAAAAARALDAAVERTLGAGRAVAAPEMAGGGAMLRDSPSAEARLTLSPGAVGVVRAVSGAPIAVLAGLERGAEKESRSVEVRVAGVLGRGSAGSWPTAWAP